MSVLGRLFGKRGTPVELPAEREIRTSEQPAQPAASHRATPQPYLDVELPPGMLGVGDEPERTHLPSHAPVERLPAATQPERQVELKELQDFRSTPGFKNFMDKTKRPPGMQPRRPSFPDDLKLPRDGGQR